METFSPRGLAGLPCGSPSICRGVSSLTAGRGFLWPLLGGCIPMWSSFALLTGLLVFSRACGERCARVRGALCPGGSEPYPRAGAGPSFPCWFSWGGPAHAFPFRESDSSQAPPVRPLGVHPDRLSRLSWESPAERPVVSSPAPGGRHPGRPALLRAAWVSLGGRCGVGACPRTPVLRPGLVLSPLMPAQSHAGDCVTTSPESDVGATQSQL